MSRRVQPGDRYNSDGASGRGGFGCWSVGDLVKGGDEGEDEAVGEDKRRENVRRVEKMEGKEGRER